MSAKDRLDEISRGDRTGGEHIQLVAALRAVLELHYDIEIPRLICSVCRVSWPCPTVKAIEEALR